MYFIKIRIYVEEFTQNFWIIILFFIFKRLTEKGITIISAFSHTNTAGTRISSKIVRHEEEIDYLFNEPTYNFNYQTNAFLNQPIQVSKSDDLILTCNYQTINRTNFTISGYSTTNSEVYFLKNYFIFYPFEF